MDYSLQAEFTYYKGPEMVRQILVQTIESESATEQNRLALIQVGVKPMIRCYAKLAPFPPGKPILSI